MRSKILAVILVVGVVLVAVIAVLHLTAQAAPACPPCLPDAPRPLVIAHQGGEEVWPSNTMYAYEHAVALGVDMLEMDLHATADGKLVLMHDETVDRTTDGTGKIEEMTLAEFKALDGGYYWTDDGGRTYPFRGQGITPASLDEVFSAFPDMPMNIEIKLVESQPVAELFCQAIRDYGMTDKVLVASFHQDAMDQFRALCPEVTTSLAQNEVIDFFVRHKLLQGGTYSPPAAAVQVPEKRAGLRVLTAGFVDDAHKRGMDVHAWTINEVDDMQRMIDLGVDGIITDRPDLLMELLGR